MEMTLKINLYEFWKQNGNLEKLNIFIQKCIKEVKTFFVVNVSCFLDGKCSYTGTYSKQQCQMLMKCENIDVLYPGVIGGKSS